MDYKEICVSVTRISKEIGQFILQERAGFTEDKVAAKTYNNLVSYVDKEAEKRFVKQLMLLIPNCGVLGEEGASINLNSDYIWIIDPLDGTTNFVHGIPVFCTSVALQYKKQTVVGVVYEPNRDECFYAWEGGASYCNDSRLEVSATARLQDSLLATGFPYDDFSKVAKYMEVLQYLIHNTRGIRRLGAAALDLCYVAAGRFDGFYEYALQPWDVAAGSFIVQQAGGKVCDFEGQDSFIFNHQIVADNGKLNLLDVVGKQLR